MSGLSKTGQTDFNAFVKGAKFTSLQILYLHGGDDMNFHLLASDTWKHLISVTQKQVYIDSFSLTEGDLEDIFESCTEAKQLFLVNCRVDDISDKFVIDRKKTYTIRSLDLYYTLMNDHKYIDKEKMNNLVESLAETNLKTDLKSIHCFEEDFSKSDLESIISAHKLSAKAIVDDNEPSPDE